MTLPWLVDAHARISTTMRGLKGSPETPISLEEMEQEYCRLTLQPYPIKELVFAHSWMLFRVCLETFTCSADWTSLQLSIIAQGIAARYARRQASSAGAATSVDSFPVIGALARKILEEQGVLDEKSKL